MNNVYNDQTIESLTAIVDALALATRVSRHSEFRFVYFGDSDNFKSRVRHLIQERLSNEFSLATPLKIDEVDMLVERFLNHAHPAMLSGESTKRLRSELPRTWAEIAG